MPKEAQGFNKWSERIKFVSEKIRSLVAKAGSANQIKGLQRELYQLEVYRANGRALRSYRRRPLRGKLQDFRDLRISAPAQPNSSSFRNRNSVGRQHRPTYRLGQRLRRHAELPKCTALGALLRQRLRKAFEDSSDGAGGETRNPSKTNMSDSLRPASTLPPEQQAIRS